jgi:hypothetical protein
MTTIADASLLEVNEALAAQILANGCAFERSGWHWDSYHPTTFLGYPAQGAETPLAPFTVERRRTSSRTCGSKSCTEVLYGKTH